MHSCHLVIFNGSRVWPATGYCLHTCLQMLLLCVRAVLRLADNIALPSLALQLLGALLISLPSAHVAHLMSSES